MKYNSDAVKAGAVIRGSGNYHLRGWNCQMFAEKLILNIVEGFQTEASKESWRTSLLMGEIR